MKQNQIENCIFTLKDRMGYFYCVDTLCDYNLTVKCIYYIPMIYKDRLPQNWDDKRIWKSMTSDQFSNIAKVIREVQGLGGLYEPAASLKDVAKWNLINPDPQDDAVKAVREQLTKAVGNVAEFVAERLQYSIKELGEVLGLEQIDSVALAIYNCEARKQGFICGDQTGIGKGRIAGALIRYAIVQGYKPVFFTENDGLFASMLRDLKDIHCLKYRPFVVNGKDVADKDTGEVIFPKPTRAEYDFALRNHRLPDNYDFALCTYSQINSPKKFSDKKFVKNYKANAKQFLIREICAQSFVICDESHNIGGNVKEKEAKDTKNGTFNSKISAIEGFRSWSFFNRIFPTVRGVLYLSATFAKRADNMPNYAINTCISDDALTETDITNLFRFGGAAVQEIVSNALVEYGQMLRRERPTDGIDTRYITLDQENADKYGTRNMTQLHNAIYSRVIDVMVKIRKLEYMFIEPYFAKEFPADRLRINKKNEKNLSVGVPKVKRMKCFQFLFDLINPFLFALKAEDIAERTIQHLKEGKKVAICFSNTFESLLKSFPSDFNKGDDDMDDDATDYDNDSEEDDGIDLEIGQEKKMVYPEEGYKFDRVDFMAKFRNVFRALTRYSVTTMILHKDADGKRRLQETARIHSDLKDKMYLLGPAVEEIYNDIKDILDTQNIGITISPIDIIIRRIEEAGFRGKVSEATGRTHYLEFNKDCTEGIFHSKEKPNVNKCYEDFNNNVTDVLLINKASSTGQSAHAIPTPKVPKDKVKQRVMIIGQSEGDINTEVQKRGRINRTGQIKMPIYEYIYSDIPCERKTIMNLRKKLKSLDANTSSDQNATETKDDIDYYNIYGEMAIAKVLAKMANDEDKNSEWCGYNILAFLGSFRSDLATSFISRMQALPINIQNDIWESINAEYIAQVEKAKQEGNYYLESMSKEFDAKLISEHCLTKGDNENSRLTSSTFICKYDIKAQTGLPDSNLIKSGIDKSEEILKNLEDNYNNWMADRDEALVEVNGYAKDRLNNEIDSLASTVARKKQVFDILSSRDDDSPEYLQKLDEALKALDEAEKKLKDLKDNFDKNLEEKMAKNKADIDESKEKIKAKYMRLKRAVKAFKIGEVYKTESNIYYAVSEITANFQRWREDERKFEDIDLLNAPANISVHFFSTDLTLKNGVDKNLADNGLTYLETEILPLPKTTLNEWDKFIKSNAYRQTAYIATGNIIPVVNRRCSGSIIRFTKHDGSIETGFLINMQEDPITHRMALPKEIDRTELPVAEHKDALKKALVKNNVSMDFSYLERGMSSITEVCNITTQIFDEKVKYYLKTNKFIQSILNIKDAKWLEGFYITEITNLDELFDLLALNNFKAKISFSILDQLGISNTADKYKMQDWAKLRYDKNKIPKR